VPDPIDIFTRQQVTNDVPEPEADEEVVGILEMALADARAGTLESVIIIGMSMESIMEGMSGSVYQEPHRFIGALEVSKGRLVKLLTQSEEDEE